MERTESKIKFVGLHAHSTFSVFDGLGLPSDHMNFAYENGCEWHPDTTYMAVTNSHLECLKYAHENGCPWNYQTTWRAAINSNLECLLYCLEKDCPIHCETLAKLYGGPWVLNQNKLDKNLLINKQ